MDNNISPLKSSSEYINLTSQSKETKEANKVKSTSQEILKPQEGFGPESPPLNNKIATIETEDKTSEKVDKQFTEIIKKETIPDKEGRGSSTVTIQPLIPELNPDYSQRLLRGQPKGTYVLRKVDPSAVTDKNHPEYGAKRGELRFEYINQEGNLRQLAFVPFKEGYKLDQADGKIFPSPSEILAYIQKENPDLKFIMQPDLSGKVVANRLDPRNLQTRVPPFPIEVLTPIPSKNIDQLFESWTITSANCPLPGDHPLNHIDEVSSEGLHFSHLNSSSLKGGNLTLYRRNVEGEEKDILQFHLSAFAKEELQGNLQLIMDHPEKFKEHLMNSPLQGLSVKIRENGDAFMTKMPGTEEYSRREGYSLTGAYTIEIDVENVGKVIIGNTPGFGNLYDKVQVELDSNLTEGEAATKVHQLLSILGIVPIMSEQKEDDLERMKIAQLFRAFYPSQALQLERDKRFYQCSIPELKEMISALVPDMQWYFSVYLEKNVNVQRARLFEAYFPTIPKWYTARLSEGMPKENFLDALNQVNFTSHYREEDLNAFLQQWDKPDLLEEQEIYDGKTVWVVKDLSIRMRAYGSCGLIHGVGSRDPKGLEGASLAVTRMLRHGLLSTEDRFSQGLMVNGVSSDADLAAGGGDRVFCREVNQRMLDKDVPISAFKFSGGYQLLIDLEVVNRAGSYAYKMDYYGTRNPYNEDYQQYASRKNLLDFSVSNQSLDNEVMIKNRVPPQFIRGIVCKDENGKAKLLEDLKKDGLIVTKDGQEYVQLGNEDRPLESFIHVATQFKREFWTK